MKNIILYTEIVFLLFLLSINFSGSSTLSNMLSADFSEISLPVELIYFNAELSDGKVDITWGTASEINSRKFEIEKAEYTDTGSGEYYKIVEVEAAGTSSKVINYGPLSDKEIEPGKSYYYRLKETDLDGSCVFSNEAMVTAPNQVDNNYPGRNCFSVEYPRPNPVKNNLFIEYQLPAEGYVNIEITDIYGNNSFSVFKGLAGIGTNSLSVDLNHLPQGVYLCAVKYDNKIIARQINIIK